jgi:branched-chain amino acid aminotransferase
LHYGQEAFERLKAYVGKDGKIRLLRWEESAKRMVSSAEGIKMAAFPVEMFREALFKVIQLNKR